MLRRMLIIITAVLSLCYLGGCEEESSQTDVEQEEVIKTSAEYQQEAQREITSENMEAELRKIEEELNQELSEEE